MQRIFVLDSRKQPLMPCTSARARILLREKKAVVFRQFPFTILLKERESGDTQRLEVKIDPGSQRSGVAIVLHGKERRKAVWAAHINHRGKAIRHALNSRSAIRRGRRNRKTRYRVPRFENRCRVAGWLAPSLISRVNNVKTWVKRLKTYTSITDIALEVVCFDTQLLQNPEITGVEYQQGKLFGYEVKEYILEKWQRTCAYCDAAHVALEIEHIVPISKGGSDRVSNLTLACRPCNVKKANMTIQEFLIHDSKRLQKILNQSERPLKDAAAVNATRHAIKSQLSELNVPVYSSSGAQTKFNRVKQGYHKDHWVDAACIGQTGSAVFLPKKMRPLIIHATGRGSRLMCRVNQYGFPRQKAKSQKQVHGFKTGDLVKAIVTKGKKEGMYQGRVAIRSSGSFNIKTEAGVVEGIHYKYCSPIHRADGYNYYLGGGVSSPR